MPRAETTTIGVPIPSDARRLDQLPAVELGKHQVEHADVGVLEAQACEPELAPADDDRVEAGGIEVTRHAVRDHVVVLDDQDLAHATYDSRRLVPMVYWWFEDW